MRIGRCQTSTRTGGSPTRDVLQCTRIRRKVWVPQLPKLTPEDRDLALIGRQAPVDEGAWLLAVYMYVDQFVFSHLGREPNGTRGENADGSKPLPPTLGRGRQIVTRPQARRYVEEILDF